MVGQKVRLVKLDFKEKYQRLVNKDLGSCGIKAGHLILKPDESVGEHTTGDREEVIVILKGTGEVIINKKDYLKVEDNAVLYIPPQTIHDIKNTGSEILEYVFITSSASS